MKGVSGGKTTEEPEMLDSGRPVTPAPLTEIQRQVVTAGSTSFLLGPAGTGKSTALQHRLLRLLHAGEPAYTILVLIAEDEDRDRFLQFLHTHGAGPYANLTLTTYSYLAREMANLFWPLVARPAGFDRPYQPPSFLSYDLAQLLMWQIVNPMLSAGAFADLRLRPQQIISQLLDTLNRAALNRLTLAQAARRQTQTWAGEQEHLRYLREAEAAARAFRQHCLQHSVLDLSLTVRVFDTQLVEHTEFHRYFRERFRHLLVDNAEEQTPAGQHFVEALMDTTETTAIVYDAGGGYKRFLSADPAGANRFYDLSEHVFLFEERFTASTPLVHLSNLVQNYLGPTQEKLPTDRAGEAILDVVSGRYRRDMVQRLMPSLNHLLTTEGIDPNQIAVVAPYLDGTLRYMLAQEMQAARIPYTLLRRRSTPRDEPRIRAWLTWLALAHPEWEMLPAPYDVAEALALSFAGLDPARAQLLANSLYNAETGEMLPIEALSEQVVSRIGLAAVEQVATLREWLLEEGAEQPLDRFLQRLFNDLLARPPFQPEPDVAGAAVSEWLVSMAGRLREAAPGLGWTSQEQIGRAFLNGVNQGLVTANPPELGEPPDPDGVLISTMYGYLLTGRDVRVQVWLEASGHGWWDIPRQPLSNAFVLARSRPADRVWTMEEDFRLRNELLSRLVRGLTARCRDGVILAASELDRRAQRQDGPLWRALQPLLSGSSGRIQAPD